MASALPMRALPVGALPPPLIRVGDVIITPPPPAGPLNVIYRPLQFTRTITRTLRF